ncbi:MAG: nucleotide exchange factor GrpE [Gemmatimonadota bacterium]|nr:nucleotide exchange factor GrpE [Gemmatimonadota bacterium]
MKNSRKKGSQHDLPDQDAIGSSQHDLPDQDAMGSEDDFAPGGNADASRADEAVTEVSDPDRSSAATAAVEGEAGSEIATEREKYLRLAAEYDNYRKRSARERSDAGARAQADLVRQMVEALDDLARFAHVDPGSTDAETIVQGVDMVEKKMMKALGSAGLRVINPVGETFDPALHEAVATEPTSAAEDDHVVARVYQPGYVFNTQLLRPARVVVKQWNG